VSDRPAGATLDQPALAGGSGEDPTVVFALPSLGADMELGTVLEWYVQPGDEVERGSVVALVATEKADIDVEIWQEGTVTDLLIDVGIEIPVGTPMLRLTSPDAGPGGRPAAAPPAPSPPVATPSAPATTAAPTALAAATPRAEPPAPAEALAPAEAAVPPRPAPEHRRSPSAGPVSPGTTVAGADVPRPRPTGSPRPRGDVIPASPLARGMAAERNLDLGSIPGSGPGGAIVARDVERAAASMPAAAPPSATTPRARGAEREGDPMRRAIAARMAKANQEIPHYHLDLDLDLAPALAWLEDHNATLSVAERVLPAVVLLKATAAAATAVPELNGYWVDDRFEPATGVDLAVAISLRRGGLVTPVITGVDERSIDEIMAVLKEMVTAARTGSLRSSWMISAGLTVTNLGDRGVDRVGGVIFPPQVSLVGFGRVRQRPWVVDGAIEPRPIVTATLAADHRATDGAVGSRFLHALADHLQNPEER
jgi:pyruvate dehydrogenase E2 component (dihydrolipoamide acetyltransferase)